MFLSICEVCKAEPQFKTMKYEQDENKKVNVCMDCAYMLEDLKKDSDPRYKLFFYESFRMELLKKCAENLEEQILKGERTKKEKPKGLFESFKEEN